MSTDSGGPSWAKKWLIAAGIYNLVWGAAVIAFPNALFDFAGMEPPLYPQIWQCVGMIVGVYGIGYLAAARDSRRHWPIVLVGLLGKIFGPLGFAQALIVGDLPPAFGVTILTNDLIWWIPFSMMLWDAAKHNSRPGSPAPASTDAALDSYADQNGTSLRQLSTETPLVLVFVRHSGCLFCGEMMADLATRADAIRAGGRRVGIVTMSDAGEHAKKASKLALGEISWISDPDAGLYRLFGLPRGRFGQLFGASEWLRGFAATLRGHFVGRPVGNGFQLPG
ncbi:MAG: redoxin domain-containing protein, partial [Planctomycetota bacterium]